jgi:hypothetical protein
MLARKLLGLTRREPIAIKSGGYLSRAYGRGSTMKPRLGNSFDYCVVGNAKSLAAKEVVHLLQEAGFSVHCLNLNSILAGDSDLVADEFKAIVFLLENDEKQTRVMALVINRLAADPEYQRIIALKFDDLPDVELSPHLTIDLSGVNEEERKRRILETLSRQRAPWLDHSLNERSEPDAKLGRSDIHAYREADEAPKAHPAIAPKRPPKDLRSASDALKQPMEYLPTTHAEPDSAYAPPLPRARGASARAARKTLAEALACEDSSEDPFATEQRQLALRDAELKLEQLEAAHRKAPPAQTDLAKKDIVEFGVSHPTKVAMGITFIVGVLVYRQEDRRLAVERAPKDNDEFGSGGATKVVRGTELRVELELPWPVEPKSYDICWNGLVTSVSFQVLPNRVPATKVLYGSAKISTDGLMIGLVPFKLMIDQSGASETVISRAEAFKRAFASYASQDRRSVLARVQGIEKVGVNVFMDVHSLRANDKFHTRIFAEIDRADVLYLFWSRHAKRSSWVEKEWRYGLNKKGLGFIDPVPLVDPRKAVPPAELAAHKHFNDWALVYSEYERRRNLWTKFRTFISN